MANALLNMLQAASNSAASNVSAPVDGIAWLLRKAGIPIPENALGSSNWMAQQGLMAPVQQGAGQVAGETLGLLAGPVAALKAPQIAGGLLAAERNLAAPAVVNRGGAAGQRGIFMGDLSKTWNKEAAEKAKAMEKAGKDARTIWQETGTFKGADGKWRQEIDDSAAKMSGALDENWMSEAYKRGGVDEVKRLADYVPPYLQEGRRELGDVFSHPQLTSAYPWATQNRTYKLDARNPVIGEGSYSPNTGVVTLSRANEPTARSVMLHELQHAVQDAQGFAPGGSPNMQSIEQVAKSIYDNAIGQFSGPPEKLMDMARHNAYRRLAGEVEARAVQKRMNLTAEQRRALFPLDSYDVPVNSLIVP